MFYTYILINSKTCRYYIGYTPDLRNRLHSHLAGNVKSTKSDLHYELAWYCAFPTRSQALLFEKYLKSGSGKAFMFKRFLKYKAIVLEKNFASLSDDSSAEAFGVGGNPARGTKKIPLHQHPKTQNG